MFYQNDLKTTSSLSQPQKKALAEFEKIFASGSKEEKIAFAKALRLYAPEDIYQLTAASDGFKRFCKEYEIHYLPQWSEMLKEMGYFGFEIQSTNKKESFGVFNQYIASYLFALKQENSLDKACDLGLYHALIERCSYNLKTIPSLRDNQRSKAQEQLLTDSERLANLYSTLGNLHACFNLISLGDFYQNQNETEYAALSKLFFEKAVVYFICAEKLFSDTMSQNIIKTICENNNLTLVDLFGSHFKSFESAKENYILAFIDNDINKYFKLADVAKTKINEVGDSKIPSPTCGRGLG
jgi:hypothetical protein